MKKQSIKLSLAIIIFFGLLWLVETNHANVIDDFGFKLFHGDLFSATTPWMLAITDIAEPGIWIVIMNAFMLYLFFIRHKAATAIWVAFLIDGGIILATLIKIIVARSRPLHQLIHDTGYSFPSIHTMVTAMLIFLILSQFKTHGIKYWIVQILGIFWIILVAISRVYLRDHFPSDVIAGGTLAYIWGSIMLIIRTSYNLPNNQR